MVRRRLIKDLEDLVEQNFLYYPLDIKFTKKTYFLRDAARYLFTSILTDSEKNSLRELKTSTSTADDNNEQYSSNNGIFL